MAILELAQVSLQVLLRNPNISPLDAALNVRPERLDGVRMNITPNVFFRAVIDRAMEVAPLCESTERPGCVRGDKASFADKLFDMGQHAISAAVAHDATHNLAVALDHSEHHGLVVFAHSVFAADEGLVDFDHAIVGTATAKRRVAVYLPHVLPDQEAHAPRRLVGDAKLPLDLFSGHAVPRSAEQEHDVVPIMEGCAGLLEGRPGGRIDLIAAMLALEGAPSLDPVEPSLPEAGKAGEAFTIPNAHQMREAGFLVGETGLKLADIQGFVAHEAIRAQIVLHV